MIEEQMIKLGVRFPVLATQVKAASDIYDHLEGWAATNRALVALATVLHEAEAFREREYEAALIRVAAVNQLYATNVYAVARMAARVITLGDRGQWTFDTVDELANLPRTKDQKTERRHVSFASKYAHFFVDAGRFPIYDSYALVALGQHLATTHVPDPEHPYRSYAEKVIALLEASTLDCGLAALDRYLWLAGQLITFRKSEAAAKVLNREVLRFFEDEDQKEHSVCRALLGSVG
jgi:hypothetical protein